MGLTIGAIALLIFLVFMIFMILRNNAVYKFRDRVIDEVYDNENWEEKRKEYISVSYNEMVFKFWKPLKSFYKTLGKN